MRKVTLSSLKKKCDIEFSKLIREKAYCERCGSRNNKLDCAHIIPRGNQTLRFDPMNALSLCYPCHLHWWHSNPLEATDWFSAKYPNRYTYLMEHKNKLTKRTIQDYRDLLTNLKEKNIKQLLVPIAN